MKENWFVALPVAAQPWLTALTRTVPQRVRVFHAEDVHMTVSFLGPVGQTRAYAGWRQLENLKTAPVTVYLGKLTALGDPRRPSAVSLTVDGGHDEAAALVGRLREPICQAAGARPDRRPPLPHVTIARIARSATAAQRQDALSWLRAQEPLGLEVKLSTVALYTWSANRQQRQFRIVERRSLDVGVRGAAD